VHYLALLGWNLGAVFLHLLLGIRHVGVLAQTRSELALGLILGRSLFEVALVVYVKSFYFATVGLLSVLQIRLLLGEQMVVACWAESWRLVHHSHVVLNHVDGVHLLTVSGADA
jgi:hypothetical protein